MTGKLGLHGLFAGYFKVVPIVSGNGCTLTESGFFFFNLVYLLKSVLPNVACLSACQHCHYVFIVNLLFKSPKFGIYLFKNQLRLGKKEPLCVYTQVQRFSCFCVFLPSLLVCLDFRLTSHRSAQVGLHVSLVEQFCLGC